MRWFAIVAAVFSQFVSMVVAQDATDVAAPAIPAEVAADLKALSATAFDEREAAGGRLIARKLDAVGPLTHLARTGTAESSVRAFDLLRQLYRDGDDAMVEAVESAYEELLKSESPTVASRAEARVEASVAVRHRKAVTTFQKLGGVLRFSKAPESTEPAAEDESSRPIEYAMLTPKWTGGDEGLKHLRRIEDFRVRTQFRSAHLFVIKGSKISPEGLKDLETSLPGLLIQRRGPSCLGVSPNAFGNEEGLSIGDVKAGTAADRAGLRPGDVLMKFNGHVVSDFESLVDRISETQPGDKVPVVIQRNRTIDTVIVELRGWE